MTDLPERDLVASSAFWERAIAAGAVPAGSALPNCVESFGDSVELADELIDLIIVGPKRATASAFADYDEDPSLMPAIGELSVATDGTGTPRAVLLTTEIRVGPLSSVDDRFAWDEGEGNRTVDDWLGSHESFFRRYLPTIGRVFDHDMATVFERFEVLYTERPT